LHSHVKNVREEAGVLALQRGRDYGGESWLDHSRTLPSPSTVQERLVGCWGHRGWPGDCTSGSRGLTFLLHPHQASGAEMNVRGLLMRLGRVKHSLLLRAKRRGG
jgi:hypothetical protein